MRLHAGAVGAPVHWDARGGEIGQPAADVVDQGGCGLDDRGALSNDADPRLGVGQLADNRQAAGEFLLRGHL